MGIKNSSIDNEKQEIVQLKENIKSLVVEVEENIDPTIKSKE